MEIKHIGRGMFAAVDGAGNRVGPQGTREAVRAWVSEQEAATVDAAPEEVRPHEPADELRPALTVRAYEERMARDLAARKSEVSEAVKATLLQHHPSNIVERMMRDIAPILADPNREIRRRNRYM